MSGKPLFPGKSVVHQLELITDLLGTPSADTVSGVRNEKARKYLSDMRKKHPVSFADKFPKADPLALRLLQRLLAFDPKDRPTAEEALADPYFKGLAKPEREPACLPISKLEFEFERRRVTKDDVREIIYREILEYHPQLLRDYMAGNDGANYVYPSAIGHLRKQFAYLEENSGKSGPVIPPDRRHLSLPRSTVNSSTIPAKAHMNQPSVDYRRGTEDVSSSIRVADSLPINPSKASRPPPPRVPPAAKPGRAVVGPVLPYENVNGVGGSVYRQNQVVVSPNYSCKSSVPGKKNQDKYTNNNANSSAADVDKEEATSQTKLQQQPQQYHLPARKPSPLASDINTQQHLLYYQAQAKAVQLNSQLAAAMDANLLQA